MVSLCQAFYALYARHAIRHFTRNEHKESHGFVFAIVLSRERPAPATQANKTFKHRSAKKENNVIIAWLLRIRVYMV